MRWVDDGSEIVYAEHAQVGDGESTALVFFRLEFAFPGSPCERLRLSGDGGKAFGTGILDDRGNETVRSGDGNTNIRSLVPEDMSVGIQTDIPRFTYCLITSPNHAEFASGTSAKAREAALTTKQTISTTIVEDEQPVATH